MSTTLVAVGGKGSNPKTTLYVGGLEESVNEAILHAAFIPFGDIQDVNIPLDHATGKHRGFGFVFYGEKEDAADAIDNMHNSELNGRILTVNFAQPPKIKGGDKGWSHQPVWADADKYMAELEAEQELEALEREQQVKVKQQQLAAGAAAEAAATAAATADGPDPMQSLEAAAGGS
jgi:peptidyl-prolyl isomerase E (cyclophilin E)